MRAVVFAELIGLKRSRGLQTSRRGLGLDRFDPPRAAGDCERPARPQSPRPLLHLGLALSQGRCEPAPSRPTWPRCLRNSSCWSEGAGHSAPSSRS